MTSKNTVFKIENMPYALQRMHRNDITTLSFYGAYIGDDGAISVSCSLIKNTLLTHLDLNNNLE